mmetsp:Transcript_12556/g.31778  ORF Transcript_12556/g.31778 Transcript_12556/m.31778 type:complete len:691 (-) Transcript_12556:145-2217(-)
MGSKKKKVNRGALEVEAAGEGEGRKSMEPMKSPMTSPRNSLREKEYMSPEAESMVSSDSWEALAMSGQDIGYGASSSMLSAANGDRSPEGLLSPSYQMEKRLKKQEPNQLFKFARLWVQVTIPVMILFTIAIFAWSNSSIGASVVLNLSIPDTAESAIVFTSNIPPAAGDVLAEEQMGSGPSSLNASSAASIDSIRDQQWVPKGRQALLCMFTSEPMRCMGKAIVKSMSTVLLEADIGQLNAAPQISDESVQFDFFNFSLISSVSHMWEGGAYALAILIAILSGVWPYVKLISMLVLWFVPVRPNTRATLLSLLEALGKWSLIDIYVFALMMAGFRFVLDVGAIARIKIAIEAKWGIFSFCIGVLLSHILSHLMMFVHHNSQAGMLGLPESSRHFSLSSVARIRHKKLSYVGQTAIAFAILFALGCTIACTIIPTFKFTFSGVVGMLLPLDKQVTEFSLIEAGAFIPSILDNLSLATRIGEYFVVVVYYAFALVTPIMRMVACLVLWAAPLTTHQKEIMKSITSMLGTWSALDVFLVSVIASILEIGNLTSSIMGDACDSLYELLGIQCLRLDASFLTGSWVMAVAVISSLIVSRLTLTSTTAHFRRVAMLHLMALKKKYYDNAAAASEDESGVTPKVIATYSEELQRNTISTKFANLLAGSFHESMYQSNFGLSTMDAMSPTDEEKTKG